MSPPVGSRLNAATLWMSRHGGDVSAVSGSGITFTQGIGSVGEEIADRFLVWKVLPLKSKELSPSWWCGSAVRKWKIEEVYSWSITILLFPFLSAASRRGREERSRDFHFHTAVSGRLIPFHERSRHSIGGEEFFIFTTDNCWWRYILIQRILHQQISFMIHTARLLS